MSRHIFKSRDQRVTVSLDPALLSDSEPDAWRRITQWIKGAAGAIVLLLVVWAVYGTPYLRWDQPLVDGKGGANLREEDLAFTRYISIGDVRRVHAGEYGKGLPWLIFIPWGDEGGDETPPAPTTRVNRQLPHFVLQHQHPASLPIALTSSMSTPTPNHADNVRPPAISFLYSGAWSVATQQLYSWGQEGWEYGTVGCFATGGMAIGQLFKALNDQAKVNRAVRKREKLKRKALEHSTARFATVADIKACDFLSEEEGVLCGTIRTGRRSTRDVFYCGEGSISVIAPPGQGKTMTIVTGTIFNYAERHRCGLSSQNLIIHDPSSEVLSVTFEALKRAGYNVYVLTPYPEKVEQLTGLKPDFVQLDIFSWCTDDFPMGELESQLMHTMQQLVPLDPNKADSNAEYFVDDARLLGAFLALTLIVQGEKPSLPKMRKLFMDDLRQLIADAMDSDHIDGLYAEMGGALNALASGSSPQFTGGYGVLRQCLATYSEQSILGAFTLGHDGFDPSKLKHPTERTALFVISTLDKMQTLAPTTALTLNYLFDSIAADPQAGKCTAILDEVSAVAWPELPSSLEYYRKANLRAVLIWQDLQGQSERRLGKAAVKEILSVSQLLIGMGIQEFETLELFAKHCGQKALLDFSTNDRAGLRGSPDVTHSEQIKTVSLFAADAIRTMDRSELLVIGGNLPPMVLNKLYYWDRWDAIAGVNPFYES